MVDELKVVSQAVKDERTRVCSALLKMRFAFLGKARAKETSSMPADEAYEDAATMVSEFMLHEMGLDGENGNAKQS